MWVFFGEFLEHMGVLGIVDPGFFPVLTAYVLIVFFCVYKKYLPVGVSFALGHFGCIWLLHSIGIYQAELLKPQHPEAYQMLRSATGVIFFLTFLFLAFKLFKARSERAQVAYTLFAFIFLWSVVETLQVFHIVPDYTYYSYWYRTLSPGTPRSYGNSLMVKSEKMIETFKESCPWDREETRNLAGYLLKKIHFILAVEDLSERLRDRMRKEKREKVDEAILCQVIEESVAARTRANFNSMVEIYVQEFKEGKPVFRTNHASGGEELNGLLPDKSGEKIASFKTKYRWASEEARKFAGFLLEKLPFPLVTDDLSKRLDEKIKEENREKVDEILFCHVMEESFLATTLPVFNTMIKKYVEDYKKDNPVNNKGGTV